MVPYIRGYRLDPGGLRERWVLGTPSRRVVLSAMKTLLPEQANNRHGLNRLIIIVFALITIFTLGRSLVHLFAPDGGANSVASIIVFEGTPDPNRVIYFIFAQWGLAQLLFGILYVIVLFRYKNLIPLMYLFIAAEYIMRLVIGKVLKPLGDEFFAHTAPGEIGNYILVPLAIIMLVWSLAAGRRKQV